MNQETLIAELIAGFLGLSGLLGLLFRWLINSLSQKLDKAVEVIEELTKKISELAVQQQFMNREMNEFKLNKSGENQKLHKSD